MKVPLKYASDSIQFDTIGRYRRLGDSLRPVLATFLAQFLLKFCFDVFWVTFLDIRRLFTQTYSVTQSDRLHLLTVVCSG